MFPGMDPKMMKQAMKKLGIKQEEIDASQVIIKCPDKDIIVTNPSIQKINMQGQDTFQVAGEISEESASSEPDINEEDVQTVMGQANVSKEEAIMAIKEHQGDLAKAIMELKGT